MTKDKKSALALFIIMILAFSSFMTGCGNKTADSSSKNDADSQVVSEESEKDNTEKTEADPKDSSEEEPAMEEPEASPEKNKKQSDEDESLDGVWKMGGREEIPADAKEYHETWDEMVDTGWVDRELLGYPSDGDERYPVYLYHMIPGSDYVDAHYKVQEGEIYERPKILVTSGFHGSEKAAPTFLKNLIEDMMTDPELASVAARYEWDIIPLVNPWGYSHSLLKNGKLTNGVVYDNFKGYEVVENGEYIQGVRLNADEQDCNRDWHDGSGGFPSEEARLVRDVLINGAYDMVLDMHQTKNNTACGFISVGKKTEGMRESKYKDNCSKVFTAATQAGIETDRLISGLYSVDTIKQTTYPWDGTDESTFRNYASGFTAGGARKIDLENVPKYSLCLEISLYCKDYSGDESDVSYNEAANTFGNTFVHHFALRLEDLL